MANKYREEAIALKDKMIKWHRDLHQTPELGLKLPNTSAYIQAELDKMGISYNVSKENSHVVALLGQGEKCVLLRADMDALPICEESGLDFASENGNMHACGHDMHATALLGAAAMLKAHESELKGQVKLLFQSGEEVFKGAETAMAEGVLENPHVDVAYASHVASIAPVGVIGYGHYPMSAVYGFKIDIKGRGTHGSTPEQGVSPINTAVHIYLALQELVAREVAAAKEVVITVGRIEAGSANNVIPETAVIEGTLRVFDPEVRTYMIKRIEEVAKGVASTYRTEASVTATIDCPAMINDVEFHDELVDMLKKENEDLQILPVYHAMGSEDFAFFCDKVPSCYLAVGAMYGDEYPVYSEHNPKVRHSEDVLPIASAVYCMVASEWLERHA